MKKTLLLLFMVCMMPLASFAQKTITKVQETQARLLDVTSNAYVHPLTVELKVDQAKGRIKYPLHLSKEQVEHEMRGDMTNIRSYGVFKACEKYNCDVIVAATFNFRSSDDGGYDLEVVGFPANFINWKTATAADYDWIKLEKVQTTSERDKINAIIK